MVFAWDNINNRAVKICAPFKSRKNEATLAVVDSVVAILICLKYFHFSDYRKVGVLIPIDVIPFIAAIPIACYHLRKHLKSSLGTGEVIICCLVMCVAWVTVSWHLVCYAYELVTYGGSMSKAFVLSLLCYYGAIGCSVVTLVYMYYYGKNRYSICNVALRCAVLPRLAVLLADPHNRIMGIIFVLIYSAEVMYYQGGRSVVRRAKLV
jgi:hypothetical protein